MKTVLHVVAAAALLAGCETKSPAWEKAGAKTRAGKGSLFDFWQLGAPEFLKFIDE